MLDSNNFTLQRVDGPVSDFNTTLPRLLRVEETAFIAGLSRAQLNVLIANGQLLSLKIGRSRRTPLAELTEWLGSRVTSQASLTPSES